MISYARKSCHITTAHPRYDTRIFYKMCSSLAAQGYEVNLIVADGKGDGALNGVNIFDVGASSGRRDRIIDAPNRAFKKAVETDADIYHLHDPELIPTGLKLKRQGKTVIFDSHEDVPKQLLAKPYLNKPVLWALSRVFSAYETWACARFDGVIAATPYIRDKFLSVNPNTVDVNNFPLPGELESRASWSEKRVEVCYVGSIGRVRGMREICAAMDLLETNAMLSLAGSFTDPLLEQEVKVMPGWKRVNELGFLNREEVRMVLDRSMAGLVTLHPVINYIDALPVKMFEYMSVGIPVIASDFPLWRKIIEGNDCGLLVDPLKPDTIARAIDKLVSNPELAHRMGRNGRKAVEDQYNWQIEEGKLLAFYDSVLSHNL